VPEKIGVTQPFITELIPEVKPVTKSTFSCCGSPEFMHALAATTRRQVLICGIETHVCVYQTAIDLKTRGYEVALVTDAVSSRSLTNTAIAIEKMTAFGISVTSVEMIAMELIRDAKHPKFKEVLQLIK
jgi:nicotinamidase-related amidase